MKRNLEFKSRSFLGQLDFIEKEYTFFMTDTCLRKKSISLFFGPHIWVIIEINIKQLDTKSPSQDYPQPLEDSKRRPAETSIRTINRNNESILNNPTQ